MSFSQEELYRAAIRGYVARGLIYRGEPWRCPYGRFKTLDLYEAWLSGFNMCEVELCKISGKPPKIYKGAPRDL